MQQTNAPTELWHSVASSASGSNLAAVVDGGGIYTSTNSGVAWTQQPGAPIQSWTCLASSANGSNLVAGISGSGIWGSTNAGVNWAQEINAPNENWESLACSADGSKLAAVAYNQGIWVSTNSGATWAQANAPGSSWFSVTCSSDGTKMAAVAYNGGGIWTAQAFPPSGAPLLHINFAGNVIKVFWQNVSGWALYQNSSLVAPANWMLNSGTINTVNGTNYLTIPLPVTNTFYRLEQ